MAENSGPEEGAKGVVEDVKGKGKEALGTVTGRDDLTREGKAQQDKADAERNAAKRKRKPNRRAEAPRPQNSARRLTSDSPGIRLGGGGQVFDASPPPLLT